VILSTRRPASRVATPVPVPVVNGSNGQERNSVVLGPNDRVIGQVYIEGDVRVAGTVEGTLEATGDVEISGAGKVKGDVTAYNRLTVGSDASLIAGDVRVARLTVEDGATFSGKVSMGKFTPAAKPAEPPPAPVPVTEPVIVAEAPKVVAEPVPAKPMLAKPLQKGKRR
jgi:cytoskeletal protein CcmA (bactofilin family)